MHVEIQVTIRCCIHVCHFTCTSTCTVLKIHTNMCMYMYNSTKSSSEVLHCTGLYLQNGLIIEWVIYQWIIHASMDQLNLFPW